MGMHFKRYISVLIYSCLFLTCSYSGLAQNETEFNHITIENGLSQSTVYSITQDKNGFMWFATRDGLNRYDSRNIKVYRNNPENLSSLSWDVINSLLSDSKGNLWIGTAKGLNRYNSGSDSFTQIFNDNKNPTSLSHNSITKVYEDKKGNIWVGTDFGLNLLQTVNDFKFKRFFQSDKEGIIGNQILAIKEDSNGNIWVGTNKGLSRLVFQNGAYKSENYSNSYDLKRNYIRAIEEDAKGNIWIGTEAGLSFIDYRNKQLVSYHDQIKIPEIKISIRKIKERRDGVIWIGTFNGIYVYDPIKQTFNAYKNDPENPRSLNQNSVYDIFEDKDKSIWIGTYYGGINVIYPHATHFVSYKKNQDPNSLGSNIISAIVEDRNNNLLIGTQEAGLNIFDPNKGIFLKYRNKEGDANSISSDVVKVIYKDKQQNIWLGSYHLQLYNEVSRSFYNFKPLANDKPNYINAICENENGKYWIATRDPGLYLFDYNTSTFQSADSLTQHQFKDKVVRSVYKDANKNVWFGTDAGLFILSANSKKVKQLKIHTADNINIISQDSKKRIWVGAVNGGLSLYHPVKNNFTTFTTANGLPSNSVIGILEDNNGFLWLSTDNGLSRFDTKNLKFNNYDVQDGLPGNVFNQNSFYKDYLGNLYFGCYNGLVKFNPSKININNTISPVVFTGLKVYDESDSKNHFTDQHIASNSSLVINYRQNIFTVNFAILNYIKPLKNKYAYKLQGFEKNWNYVDNPSATYTNLPSGNYTLLVKGANNDGIWNATPLSLNITILPPPWLTWWAYTFYALIIAGILTVFIRYILIRDRLKREDKIHQMKLDFFTNISHELRTPLTLILGPLESLLNNQQVDRSVKSKLSQAKYNADRLLRLVSELLDFRKTETGNLQLQVGKHDLVSFSKKIFLSFQDLAERKNIQYDFQSDKDQIELYFDDIQLEKVLFNLLANAFKFTESGGSVDFRIVSETSFVNLKISDTGKGIPIESQDKIFTNYYQVKEFGKHSLGSGIGLALSKSIVELHNGSITFNSQPQDQSKTGNTCFSIKLKLGSQHFSKEQLFTDELTDRTPLTLPLEIGERTANNNKIKKYDLLIVEDNEAINKFIAENLKLNYNVFSSYNGLQGLEIAFEKIPDLIISDVMMPELDGIEFSKRIKNDHRTSHIPLILLTALSDQVHQINGLQTGADLYLSKPFSIQVLELSVQNLLSSRDTMRKKFSQELTLQPSNIAINNTEEIFLNKLIKLIEDNLINPDFKVDVLGSELGMSRNVLYRKIDALTGMSVNDFIKSIRLKTALKLMETQQYVVYEVATMVGFNDHKYFSKEFKKQFGRSPSSYKEVKTE